jgi:DUF1365 family protein
MVALDNAPFVSTQIHSIGSINTLIMPTGIFHCFDQDQILAVLRQVHNLFQTKFSEECDPELPASTSNIFLLPSGHSTAAYVSFLAFLSL